MRFFILMMVFGIVAVALETTWLSGLPAQSVRFDFIIVAVAAISFSFEWRQALPVIIFYALIADAASSAPFGISLFSYIIVYAFIRTIISKISFQVGLGLIFWVAIISLADKILISVAFMASTGEMTIPRIIMRSAPLQAIFDAAIGFALVPFLRWYWDLSWEKITRPSGLVMK